MSGSLQIRDAERFRDVVARRLGLQFEDAKLGWLGDVLQRRIESRHLTGDVYLGQIEASAANGEFGALAQELTVAETYFFRNIDQFRALQERVLPERLRARATRRSLRILSAGCASGEEPYSIAMTLHGLLPDLSWKLAIDAIDLNPEMISRARRARYTAWSLRETPAAMQERWFHHEGREQALDNTIRAAVSFEVRNLCTEDAEFWRPGTYDIVFCRNVLMYFTPQSTQAAMARITKSLAPHGFLFVGHAETLRGLSSDFELQHTHGTFYYQRKDSRALASTHDVPARGDASAARHVPRELVVDAGSTWIEAIGRAAGRIRELTAQPAQSHLPQREQGDVGGAMSASVLRDPGEAPRPAAWHLGPALELLRQERFAQALDLMQVLPPEAGRDPDVLLLLAVLLTHDGELDQAEDACHRLLAIDGLSAGAHYVLALCREGAGDYAGAADRDRVAAYLDPAFAMPHLHLGLLARRAVDHEAVQRELSLALALLEREEASRLMLFGGGFNRQALLALCRSELQACTRPS